MHEKLLEFIEQPNWTASISQNKSPEIQELGEYLRKLTDFLPPDATNRQRGWHVANDCYSVIMCELCKDKPVKYHSSIGYARFCSKKCSANTENMHNHGFYRIYDAGKLRFVKT